MKITTRERLIIMHSMCDHLSGRLPESVAIHSQADRAFYEKTIKRFIASLDRIRAHAEALAPWEDESGD